MCDIDQSQKKSSKVCASHWISHGKWKRKIGEKQDYSAGVGGYVIARSLFVWGNTVAQFRVNTNFCAAIHSQAVTPIGSQNTEKWVLSQMMKAIQPVVSWAVRQ
ncbi:hypothetical protein AXW37_12095 [Yersinia ruckeri]|nr:hypothetical protein NJ56_00615 [Yersinia ruckeri]OEU26606.1 hypothetical protein BI323_00355 [Yersinia ruckeri]OIX36110.1 hypothetical protein AXW20_11920 [Yersinia ruckeri]OIX36178.1 hypothetical protein AXW19_11895 [Yersinia ruckeri]OIX36390.1 hypothetical protein AXW18_11905 [Yersinia ruckeri]